ncbi:hypothetical protein J3R30DRAFT_3704752 [Lentinula aciculospora]|uniref:Uncharacterized protein n=1 Tax=Lentinula aciculospora TaxID=153920 RepID=A0A9W9A8I6_9AGAR|nr:hypothetical protein J3R30DRAFT_3704752 [Lentinula aciculospora]
MSTLSSSRANSSKNKVGAGNMSNASGSTGGRTGIPTLRSLRTLFAPTSSQAKSIQVSPSRPSLNLPAPRPSMNLMPSRSSLNIHSGGNDTSSSTSSLGVVRRSMTLGRKGEDRSSSRDSRDIAKYKQGGGESDAVMDIRPSSPNITDGGGVDLSTIVEADTSGVSGISLAESLSKHLPALPPSDSPPPSDFHSPSPTPSFSPSPSPKPRSASASVSSLHLPRSPSSIHAQVHSALQVDPALAALLSPNNLPSSSFSPGSESASSSPGASGFLLSTKTNDKTTSSLHPQHASTPHASLRIKNSSHLGLIRPSYIRSPSSDDSRSSGASISRLGSSTSASRLGTSMSTFASASATPGRQISSTPRIRTRSMSVDEQSPRHTSSATFIANRRNPSFLARRENYIAHTRSLSQFGDHDITQSETDDVPPFSQRKAHQRPPLTEWLGPRTAKAFKAAGLLASQSNDFVSNSSRQSQSQFEPNSLSLSAPSSPMRPRFRPTSSYASDISHSPDSPSPSQPFPSHAHTPHPRSSSAAASAISARSGGSVRSASIRSGSVRSASTAPTSLSTSISPSGPAQAARDYLMQSQNQHSSSTLNLPTSTSFTSSASVAGASPSEVQLLKDQHSVETSALLAALSDAQRTIRVLRLENVELREALTLAENKQDSWERDRLHLKSQLEEADARLEEARSRKLEDSKLKGEIKLMRNVKTQLESRLDEAEVRVMQAEGNLCVMNEIKSTNHKLRQALHGALREKARVEAEAELRAEGALRRIEQLEDALAEASGAIGATLGMAPSEMEPGSSITNDNSFIIDNGTLDLLSSQLGFRGKTKSRTYSDSSPPSSSSSSRPPSIFPLPPENMTLLMHEEADGVTGMGERSAFSELNDTSSFEIGRVQSNKNLRAGLAKSTGDAEQLDLDASEFKWRQSIDMPIMRGRSSASGTKSILEPCYATSASNSKLGMSTVQPRPSDDHHYPSHNPSSSRLTHSISSNPPLYSEYEHKDEALVGNTTFYDDESTEGDSIISEDDSHLLDSDPDPTVRAHLYPSSPLRASSLSRFVSANESYPSPLKLETTASNLKARAGVEPGNEDDDATTSFEGTGTPGSPGSLLWMHPLDERHLGDLNGSMDSLRLGG